MGAGGCGRVRAGAGGAKGASCNSQCNALGCSVQRAACSVQHEVRRAVCGVRRAACGVRRAGGPDLFQLVVQLIEQLVPCGGRQRPRLQGAKGCSLGMQGCRPDAQGCSLDAGVSVLRAASRVCVSGLGCPVRCEA